MELLMRFPLADIPAIPREEATLNGDLIAGIVMAAVILLPAIILLVKSIMKKRRGK